MTIPFRLGVFLLPLLLISCVASYDLKEAVGSMAEHHRGPLPESEWNSMGLWRRVADQPPAYIPKDYPISAPRTDKEGKWFVDDRDGKRLFVPHRKAGGYDNGVLLGEAMKITHWKARDYSQVQPGIMVTP